VLEGLVHPSRGQAVVVGDVLQGLPGGQDADVFHDQGGLGPFQIDAETAAEFVQGGQFGMSVGRLAVGFRKAVLDVHREVQDLGHGRQPEQGPDEDEKCQAEGGQKRAVEGLDLAVVGFVAVQDGPAVEHEVDDSGQDHEKTPWSRARRSAGPCSDRKWSNRPGGHPGVGGKIQENAGQKQEGGRQDQAQRRDFSQHVVSPGMRRGRKRPPLVRGTYQEFALASISMGS
jgi:hypothetical protein